VINSAYRRRVRQGMVAAVTAVMLSTGLATSAIAQEAATSLAVAGLTEFKWNPIFGGPGGGQYFEIPAVQAVYDTLVTWNQDTGTFDPWLVAEYSISDDRSVMTMRLRDDVTFSDGEKLNAAGVVKFLTLLRDTPGQTISFVNLRDAYGAEFEVVDEYTFEFRATAAPIDHAIFQVLDNLPVPSPKALDDFDALALAPVGTGPYLLDAATSVPGVSLSFTRNEDYWNPEAYPYDTLKVVTFADGVAAFNALATGQINATAIDIGTVAQATAAGLNVEVQSGRFRGMFFGDRAGKINPAIADVRVRQAINMAFDREAINEVLDLGYGAVSSQPFRAPQAAYLEGNADYTYDPDGARELLAEAGYPDGFALTIPTLAAWTADFEPLVQQYLADIGIEVTYEAYPDVAAYLGSYTNYAVMMRAEAFINTMRSYLMPGGSFSGWGTDPAIVELVNTINASSGDEQLAAGQRLGQFLHDEAWFAPISLKPAAWASSADVQVKLGKITASPWLKFFTPAQ
jgi:peptide/nickel transport system substrate-binding protein